MTFLSRDYQTSRSGRVVTFLTQSWDSYICNRLLLNCVHIAQSISHWTLTPFSFEHFVKIIRLNWFGDKANDENLIWSVVSKFQFDCHAQSVVVQRCRIIRQSGIQTVAAARCYDEFCTPVTVSNHAGARTEQKQLVQYVTATRRADAFHSRPVLRILITRLSFNKLLPQKNVTI